MTLGVSFLLALGFLILFLWASKKGQFEDSETPAIRMLLDDEFEMTSTKQNKTKI